MQFAMGQIKWPLTLRSINKIPSSQNSLTISQLTTKEYAALVSDYKCILVTLSYHTHFEQCLNYEEVNKINIIWLDFGISSQKSKTKLLVKAILC